MHRIDLDHLQSYCDAAAGLPGAMMIGVDSRDLASLLAELRASRTPVEAGVVTREHRLAACVALDDNHAEPPPTSGMGVWVETGADSGWGVAKEIEVAQAIADAEARGYALAQDHMTAMGAARTPPAELTAELLADVARLRSRVGGGPGGTGRIESAACLDRIEAHIKGKPAAPPQEPPARAVVVGSLWDGPKRTVRVIAVNPGMTVTVKGHADSDAHFAIHWDLATFLERHTWVSDPQEGERES